MFMRVVNLLTFKWVFPGCVGGERKTQGHLRERFLVHFWSTFHAFLEAPLIINHFPNKLVHRTSPTNPANTCRDYHQSTARFLKLILEPRLFVPLTSLTTLETLPQINFTTMTKRTFVRGEKCQNHWKH